ncbi:MAG: PilW family protein [Arenicellales bacterium]
MNIFDKKSPNNQQSGFTLVELMIALVVGLILTSGILQVFLSNKQAYRTNEALSRIQEDSRLLSDILGRNLRMAGYRAEPEKKRKSIFPDASVYMGGSTSGQVVAGTSNSISIVYQADDNIQACTTSAITAGSLVKTVLKLDTATGVLKCKSAVCAPCSSSDPALDSVTGVDLAEGITSLTFTYGIDTDNDGAANRYSTTPLSTDSVTSVRARYTLQSAEKNTGVYDVGTSTGKKLNKTFTTTIALRNIVP